MHELPNAVRGTKGAKYVDEFTFMWYEFEKHGYATLLAEDTALDTLFNKNLHGFEQRPTDHYMRPFWVEVRLPDHRLFYLSGLDAGLKLPIEL